MLKWTDEGVKMVAPVGRRRPVPLAVEGECGALELVNEPSGALKEQLETALAADPRACDAPDHLLVKMSQLRAGLEGPHKSGG